MTKPLLTFFCELEADELQALFSDPAVIDDLVTLEARVSLGLLALGLLFTPQFVTVFAYGFRAIPEKFALTLAGSVGLALIVYHFAVRRITLLRVLFGMRV